MWWSEWWVWGAFALILVILEIVAPAYIFLGFGIGAAAMSVIFALGGPFAELFSGSMAWAAAGFATVSMFGWLLLRAVLGVRKSEIKTFENDVNDH